jgi:hypothetical protein
MKAILIVFMTFRYRAAPREAHLAEESSLPLWTWFIENPRRRTGLQGLER